MSIFASFTQVTVPIPFDPPNTITIRKLTGREVEAAQAAHRDGLAGGSPRLWASTFRRALERGATDPEVLKAIADPLTGYDRFAIVRAGLVAWSYDRPVKPVPAKPEVKAHGNALGAPAVEASDAVEDLDDEAVDFIATEILRLTKPALFLTEEDAKASQKETSAAAPVA